VRVRCFVRRESNLRWLPADRVELVYGAINDVPVLTGALAGITTVFHLAALTSARVPAEYFTVNVGGVRAMIDAMRVAAPDATLVLCSSQSAAGPARAGRPAVETDPPAPIGPYGESKLVAEKLVIASELRHIIVRPPAVYGPRDADILAAFKLATAGIAVRIGPVGQRISIVHARDLVAGLLAAARASHARGVYYVSGTTHPWEELVAGIGAAVGRRVRVIPAPTPFVRGIATVNRLVARAMGVKPLLTPERVRDFVQPDWSIDDGRARRDLGYASAIPLLDGLRETAAWYREAGWL
jgi:nucleoside-diphosphate-sugar epimerase